MTHWNFLLKADSAQVTRSQHLCNPHTISIIHTQEPKCLRNDESLKDWLVAKISHKACWHNLWSTAPIMYFKTNLNIILWSCCSLVVVHLSIWHYTITTNMLFAMNTKKTLCGKPQKMCCTMLRNHKVLHNNHKIMLHNIVLVLRNNCKTMCGTVKSA